MDKIQNLPINTIVALESKIEKLRRYFCICGAADKAELESHHHTCGYREALEEK